MRRGDPIWQTRSTDPMSMPSSSDAVATSAFRRPPLSRASASSRRSFEAGSRTLVDILNAEQERVSAMRDLANARYVYMMSRIRLRALAGEADEQAVQEINAWLQP